MHEASGRLPCEHATVSTGLEIRFVGTPTVTLGGAVLGLQPQEWNLLALLGVRPGRVFTSDKLQTELFGEELVEHGDRRIRTAMSKLRGKLGDDFLPRGTYVLENAAIDAAQFVELARGVRSGEEPRKVIFRLEAATELWPQGDNVFPGNHWPALVEDYRSELEQLRETVDVMLAEALTAEGDFHGASELLRPGFAVDSLPEPRARVLARSLALRGDRTAALEVLDRHEAAGEDELGVGPSASVIRLRTQIEHGEGEFALVVSTPSHVDQAHVELLRSLGRSMRLLGNPDHLETLLQAGRIARDGRLDDELGRVMIELCSHSRTTMAGDQHDETVELFDVALERESMDPGVRAEMLAASSALMTSSELWARGQANFREAFEYIKTIDDPGVQVRVLMHTHLGLADPADAAARDEAIAMLSDLATDDPDEQWEATYLRFWKSAIAGDIEGAGRELDLLDALLPQAVQRRVSPLHARTAYEIMCGNYENAENEMQRAYAFAQRFFHESWARNHHVTLLLALRIAQGRAHETADRIADEMAALGEQPNWVTGKAFVYAAAATHGDDGRREEAMAILDRLCATGFGSLRRDLSWTGAIWLTARAAVMLDHRECAAVAADLLEPYEGQLACIGHCTVGSVSAARQEVAELIHV